MNQMPEKKATTKKPVEKVEVVEEAKEVKPKKVEKKVETEKKVEKEPEFVLRKLTREEKMKYLTGNWD